MRTRIPTFIVILFLFFGFVAPALQVSLPELHKGHARWSGHLMHDSAASSLRPMRRRTELPSPGIMVLPSAEPRLSLPRESGILDVDLPEIPPISSSPSGSGVTRAPPSAPVF